MSETGRLQVQMRIERIYLKDASFESPRSPRIFEGGWRPQIKMDLNTRTSALDGGQHEVVLAVTVEAATGDNETAFIVEVQQAGLFTIEGASGEALQRVLGVACPTALFPYAREAVDGLVVKGGFPPLGIAPVNFEAVYEQALRRAAAEGGSNLQH